MMNNDKKASWKTQIYLMGGAAGLLFGLVGSYLFARAAEENVQRNNGEVQRIPTSQLVALSLTALGLIRQISEIGKGPRD